MRRARAGYLYVAVLFTSLIVAGSIATAISLDTTRLKTENAHADRASALRLAESELHRVAVQLSSDPNWRTNHADSAVSSWNDHGATAGDNVASVRYQLSDSDGDLSDDPLDATRVVAHARFGSAQAAVSVELETGFAPLDLLRYGVTSFDDIEFVYGAALVSERPIQVVDDCKTFSWGAITTSKLECNDQILVPVRGDISGSSVQAPTINVVDQYVDQGTQINLASLPWFNSVRTIRNVVLSPGQNPYGEQNENGIYWINAMGAQINIRDCRIKGTLAILNAYKVRVTGAVDWTYPSGPGAILVSNSVIELDDLAPVLSEVTTGVNFNPATTPGRGNQSNTLVTEEFASQLKGIIFTTNDFYVGPTTNGDAVKLTGLLMARDIVLFHNLWVQSLDEVMTTVPLGFVDPMPMRFRSGTFRRAPLP